MGCTTQGSIKCVNGYVDGSKITCAEACGNECCKGWHACEDFTGTVCKDGVSCVGKRACEYATVGEVIDGCNGYWACAYAGKYIGGMGVIHGACKNNWACYAASKGADSSFDIENCCSTDVGECKYVTQSADPATDNSLPAACGAV